MRKTLTNLHRIVVDAALEKKAFDILALDIRQRSDVTDFFILCSGNSKIQVQTIADSILEKIYATEIQLLAIEGYQEGEWVILDLVDVFVHIFLKDVRRYYDLERLWGDVPIIKAEVG